VRYGGLFQVPARSAAALAGAGLAAVAASAWMLGSDDRADDLGEALSRPPWVAGTATAVLLLLATVHYLCAALALRAVSSPQLPLRAVTGVQLAAAATNRVVPSGFGGVAVNLRYLVRAGIPEGAAVSALAALAVVGAATDTAYAATVTAAGSSLGLGGAARELRALAARGVGTGQAHSWVLAVVAALALTLLVRRRGSLVNTVITGARQSAGHLRVLAADPRRIAIAALTSTATTVTMSVGFVLAVDVWGSAERPLSAGALVAIYLVAATAGGATPLPPLFCVTEAFFVTALVLAGYTSSSALLAVAVFRGLSFWLPLPVGVWAARRLRRAQLL
jgi:uncharacterized membrane protein YbhN (UPF0104 family)